jgi:hypothetical protein
MPTYEVLRAPLVWIAAKLLLLLRWTPATFSSTTDCILSTLLRFPVWVLASLMEGASNWHRFFFYEVPWCIKAISRLALWFWSTIQEICEEIVDWIAHDFADATIDAHFYLTSTLPSSLHDTFGNPLGDLTSKDMSNFGWSAAFLIAVTFIVYTIQLCEGLHSPSPPSPIVAPQTDYDETKADAQATEGSSPISTPFKPKHFGMTGLFSDQSTYFPREHVTFSRPSYIKKPFFVTPITKREEIRRPIVAHGRSATQFEAPTPSHGDMDFGSPPPEPLQAPPPERNFATSQQPSPAPSFPEICQGLSSDVSKLNKALLDFHEVMWSLVGIDARIDVLYTLLSGTYKTLKQHRHNLMIYESDSINWGPSIQDFWDNVRPNGYNIVYNYESKGYGSNMRKVLAAVQELGLYLNLNLLNVDMRSPAPVPPQQFQQLPFIPQTQQLDWLPPTQQYLPTAPVQPPQLAPIQLPATAHNTSMGISAFIQASTKPVSSTPSAPKPAASSSASTSPAPKAAPISSISTSSAQKPGASELLASNVQSTKSKDSNDTALDDAIYKALNAMDSNSTSSAPNATASQLPNVANPFAPQLSSSRRVMKSRARRPQAASRSSFTPTSSPVPAPPDAPSAQASSSSVPQPQKDVSKIKLSMTVDRIGEWAKLSHEELAALKKENWDWTSDTNLWRYNCKTALALNDDATACKDVRHVGAQLNGISTPFIRACVVLRCQAKASDQLDKVPGGPQLLPTVEQTLRKAKEMYQIGGLETKLSAWSGAVLFFSTRIMDDEDIKVGLKHHYGEKVWEDVVKLWTAIEFLWLQAN